MGTRWVMLKKSSTGQSVYFPTGNSPFPTAPVSSLDGSFAIHASDRVQPWNCLQAGQCMTSGKLKHVDLGTPGANMEVVLSVTQYWPSDFIARHIHHGEEAFYVIQGATFETPRPDRGHRAGPAREMNQDRWIASHIRFVLQAAANSTPRNARRKAGVDAKGHAKAYAT